MEISELTFRLLLLFIPGIIAARIIDKLTYRILPTPFEAIIRWLLYGFICYMAYYPLTLIKGLNLPYTFFSALADVKSPLNFREIFVATSLSVPLGIAISYFENRQLFNHLMTRLKVSKKLSDLDVWTDIMGSHLSDNQWVNIRDFKNRLRFRGWVQNHAVRPDDIELFLRSVSIYKDSQDEPSYEVPAMYLCLKKQDAHIYFPQWEAATKAGATAQELNAAEDDVAENRSQSPLAGKSKMPSTLGKKRKGENHAV